MRTRSLRATGAPLLAIALAACGSGGGAPPYTLQARVGVYDDGSGRLGTAVLTTFRDYSGAGPATPWSTALRDPLGAAVATFPSPGGAAAYQLVWYADLPPAPGTWELVATSGPDAVRAQASQPGAASGLSLPAVSLAADGSRLDWPAVPGAASYLCRAYAGGALQLEALATAPGCDLSALPAGAYAAEVLALSVDLTALAASAARTPPLPPALDVSAARLGFALQGGAAAPVVLRSAGGAYDDGVDPRALAVWLSIGDAAGVATSSTWDVEVIGPNLPPGAPLSLTYHAAFPRMLAWAPGVPAAPGTYAVTARSGATAIAGSFTVGAPAWLDQPLGLLATDGAQGSASASWAPVPGARSYLLGAYDATSGALVASAWFNGTSGTFPQGTFVAGVSYDVYVAATDADMSSSAAPTQVSVAENVFDSSRFVAR